MMPALSMALFFLLPSSSVPLKGSCALAHCSPFMSWLILVTIPVLGAVPAIAAMHAANGVLDIFRVMSGLGVSHRIRGHLISLLLLCSLV